MRSLVLILLLFFVGCGDVGSSESTTVNTQDSPVDNSHDNVIGDTECTTTCEPVDSVNCNNEDSDVAVTNNVCFLVTHHCEGGQQPDGPDLTTVPPIECTRDGDEPTLISSDISSEP